MRAVLVAIVVCLTAPSLARSQPRSPAMPGWFDLSVPGGADTLADIPPQEYAFAIPILARSLHGEDRRTRLPLDQLKQRLSETTSPALGDVADRVPVSIPVPLSREIWERLLPPSPTQDLFVRLIVNRGALLLAAGLTAADDSIRSLLTRDRDLLEAIYRERPGTFAVVARSLRVKDGHVLVPGGVQDESIWEALAGASPSKPSEFIETLLQKDDGRLAWYFDTLSTIDITRFNGVWPPADPDERLAQARRLYDAYRNFESQWHIERQPYRRAIADGWSAVALLDVEDGRVAGPMWRWLWDALFDGPAFDGPDAAEMSRTEREVPSLAWFVERIVEPNVGERRARFEMVRLAQRAFRDVPEEKGEDLLIVLSHYRRFRGLLLTLERMRITPPSTWVAVIAAARHVDDADGNHADRLAAFQGAVAILERIRHVGTMDAAAADRLLRSLAETVRADDQVSRGVATWIARSLVPALPPLTRPDKWMSSTIYESTILNALAGPRPSAPRLVEWEGLSYHVDRGAAEHERLLRIRDVVMSPGLDAALANGNSQAIGEALRAIVYVVALGDPDGAAVLSDIPARHDFGLHTTRRIRNLWSWAVPEERSGDGGPWRAQGALMGLDLALARLALRRTADNEMPAKPTLTLNDLSTLARTAVGMVASELTDTDRDEIAAAIARGRGRVAAAADRVDALRVLADEVAMPSHAREVLEWIVSRQPQVVSTLFSTRDLLWLGNPAVERWRLDAWGVNAAGLDGRQVTAMPRSASWEHFTGRSDYGQLATQVPDLTLRLAEATSRLRLPAELVPALLTYAVQDYWHDVQARFSDDWLAMVRQAARLTSERIEDYVAALAGHGPLRLVKEDE